MTDTAYWDDAYTNSAYIEGGSTYPGKWEREGLAFRQALAAEGRMRADISYGPQERNRFDLFLPLGAPRGLVVFVHGGYWLQFDRTSWSHLAAGPLMAGYAVAMPSYVLCPAVRIGEITLQIGSAISKACDEIAGPLYLAGHSAGGHLVSRMVCETSPLPAGVLGRVRKVVSISGVHDLRPMMNTTMNKTLHIDAAEAQSESPVLLKPVPGANITFWVGGAERPEFRRQTRAMQEAWGDSGAAVSIVEEEGRHHFDVVEGLTDMHHPLVRTLLAL